MKKNNFITWVVLIVILALAVFYFGYYRDKANYSPESDSASLTLCCITGTPQSFYCAEGQKEDIYATTLKDCCKIKDAVALVESTALGRTTTPCPAL